MDWAAVRTGLDAGTEHEVTIGWGGWWGKGKVLARA
jgi:hypothetical protein